MAKRQITRDDIMPLADYQAVRKERRAAVVELKRRRRLEVGPFATFYFENYDTMWMQIHEMLYIEKGGEEQIADELRAYNPLIPNGGELVATLMFEIADQARRDRELKRLGGIEDTITLTVGGEVIKALPEGDVERTRGDGKTSSVHFLHFPFTAAAIAAFRDPDLPAVIAFGHPEYGHMAVLPPRLRTELAADFA